MSHKIKYLHIFGPDTKNSYGIMTQLHKYCDLEQHKFLIAAYRECKNRFPKLKEFDDLIFIPDECSRLQRIWFFLKILGSAENIIWHSMFFTTKKYLYFLFFFRGILRKSTWIEWGADLYNWEYANPTRKQKILNYMGRKVKKSFRNIGLTFPVNKEKYVEQFGDKHRFFYTPMCNPYYEADGLIKFINGIRDKKNLLANKKPGEICVQVAHNSFAFNNHVKLLNYLEQYKNENIKLRMPLSYGVAGINGQFGGKTYVNAIIDYGEKMWGEKIEIMRVGISFEDFVGVLWNTDIAVFDFDRPCGLGTIRMLLFMGKKVFIPSGNSFYDFFISKGVKVYDTNQIPYMTFEEFSKPVENTDLTWIEEYINNEKCIEHWLEMFENL